jgi:hypothetical protein
MIEFMERRRQRQKPASFTYLGPQSDLTAAEMEGNANEFAEWV